LANVKALDSDIHLAIPVLLFGALGYWLFVRRRVRKPSR
jgi:hypothetical protein